MANSRIKLDPEAVEAIARRVVVLLEQKGMRQREMIGASELAGRLGVDRSWVYSHAIELGAVKLGDGPRARLRFDPRDRGAGAAEAGRWVGARSARPLG